MPEWCLEYFSIVVPPLNNEENMKYEEIWRKKVNKPVIRFFSFIWYHKLTFKHKHSSDESQKYTLSNFGVYINRNRRWNTIMNKFELCNSTCYKCRYTSKTTLCDKIKFQKDVDIRFTFTLSFKLFSAGNKAGLWFFKNWYTRTLHVKII